MDLLTGLSKCGMQRLESVYIRYMGTLPLYGVCISMKKGKGHALATGARVTVTGGFGINGGLMSSSSGH